MQFGAISIALVVAASVAQAAPAYACDPVGFYTPYDLHDQATAVALVKVDSIRAGKATLSVIETFKGSTSGKVTLDADTRSSCSPGLSASAEGVVFLGASGQMMGAYNGFERDKVVIAALRKYAAAPAAGDGAAALVDVAVSRDWSRSFQAAYALANRVPLVLAMDSAARARVVKRLGKVGEQHTLILVGARLHDARIRALQKRRKFDYGAPLSSVLDGRFDAERDTDRLAATISAPGTSSVDRIAALERCELVRGVELARFTEYASTDASSADDWSSRASACRSGKPVP